MDYRISCNVPLCSQVTDTQYFGDTVCILLHGRIILSLYPDKDQISQAL
jgi:hypothetical protein